MSDRPTQRRGPTRSVPNVIRTVGGPRAPHRPAPITRRNLAAIKEAKRDRERGMSIEAIGKKMGWGRTLTKRVLATELYEAEVVAVRQPEWHVSKTVSYECLPDDWKNPFIHGGVGVIRPTWTPDRVIAAFVAMPPRSSKEWRARDPEGRRPTSQTVSQMSFVLSTGERVRGWAGLRRAADERVRDRPREAHG